MIASTLGIMGNISILLVFLSPLVTFLDVYKKKTTEELQSLPHVVGLFSSMLWIYYTMLNDETTMLIIAIRSVGIIIQTFYLCVFVFYAPNRPRTRCLKLIFLFVVIGFGLIVLPTQFLTKGHLRDVIVGWVFLVLSSLCDFISPLGVMTQVIKTKSVEYMPIFLVVSVTLNGIIWLFYGLLVGDFNIMIPNALGFTLGVIQIIVYFVYKCKKPDNIMENKEQIREIEEPKKDQNTTDTVIKLNVFRGSENIANPHGGVVVPSPIMTDHAIEVPA